MLESSITSITDNINTFKSLSTHNSSPKSLYPTTVVPANRKDPPLKGGHSTKNGCMWNLKHDTSSPKFYEILIKTELKGDISLELNNFYNHIKMCLNVLTRP